MSSTQDSIANKLIETVAESVKNLNHEQRAALLSKISALDGGQSKLVDQRLARVAAAAESQPQLIRNVSASLRRVGLTVDAVLSGGADVVDKAAKAYDLPLERRFELKALLRELLGAL